jgi:hypothetical protein
MQPSRASTISPQRNDETPRSVHVSNSLHTEQHMLDRSPMHLRFFSAAWSMATTGIFPAERRNK